MDIKAAMVNILANPVLTHMRAVAYTPNTHVPLVKKDEEAAIMKAQLKRDKRKKRNLKERK